ncbi:hypothetical protein A7X68_19070 [Stenotrophomonas maltophilia]|uniref:hypothetical protein n=1 Tax=Stenotrophomonas maltophilia TaxID=40324 RepID=UPI000DA9F839|nr:hypothetical protein [Stenotrophomonas maltophilia]MCI1154924.1 hypothetical protein [Stenotrophomonas maltophilia]PZS73228.1 hypothetical protein A7X68_19070 [Stenotrophomonas maltophilia]
MLDDMIKGIREYVSGKFMSPLGAALTTSWCAWNYKFLLVVLSGEAPLRKIHLIKLIYQDQGYMWGHMLFGPLATALFYVFFYPYPSNWVYRYSLRRDMDALASKRAVENQTPLTQEESRALRKKFTEIELQNSAENLTLANTIDGLKEQLRVAIQEKNTLAAELASAHSQMSEQAARRKLSEDEPRAEPKEKSRYPGGLSKLQWAFIDLVGRYDGPMPLQSLSAGLSVGDGAVLFTAQELSKLGFVEVTVQRELGAKDTTFTSLTPSGLKLFLSSLD